MKKLIDSNYEVTVNRGLIDPNTTHDEFLEKLREEVNEYLEASRTYGVQSQQSSEELSDIILVCLNTAKHFGIDIEAELWRKVEINKQRSLFE